MGELVEQIIVYGLAGLAAIGALYGMIAAVALTRLVSRREAAFKAAPPPEGDPPAVSLLVPVAGLDPAFVGSARAYLAQRYPGPLEVIFCVLDPGDPAVGAAQRALADAAHDDTPGAPTGRLAIGKGRSLSPNRKVSNLAQGLAAAKHDLIVMADADMRPAPDFVRRMVAPLVGDAAVGLSTALYRSHEPHGLGGILEALAIDADFIPAVAVAQTLGPVRFALGAAIAIRRDTFKRIGGLEPLGRYIGEDYHLGRLVAERAGRVEFAPCVLPTHVGNVTFGDHFRHQLRWARTVRTQRPWGYLGLGLTNPFVPALALAWLLPEIWTGAILSGVVTARGVSALLSALTLRSRGAFWRSFLLPLHDLVRFGIWLLGALGGRVTWRGKRYRIGRDGVIVPGELDAEEPEPLPKPRAPERTELGIVGPALAFAVGGMAGVEVHLGRPGAELAEQRVHEGLGHAERPKHAEAALDVAQAGGADPRRGAGREALEDEAVQARPGAVARVEPGDDVGGLAR